MRVFLTIIALIAVMLIGWLILRETATIEEKVIVSEKDLINTPMQLTSSAFEHNALIPLRYTCDSDRATNPPLSISGVPKEAKSLALIMDDPDVPKQIRPDGVFDHWVLFDIPAATREILEETNLGTLGVNTGGRNAYAGPCPPPQYEPVEHRYVFRLYALDTDLALGAKAAKKEVLEAMQEHILVEAELVGRYKRQ